MIECAFCGRGQKERVEESGEKGDEEYTISFMPAPGTYTPVSFKVCNSCYCSTYNLIAKKYHKYRLTMTEIKLPVVKKEIKDLKEKLGCSEVDFCTRNTCKGYEKEKDGE